MPKVRLERITEIRGGKSRQSDQTGGRQPENFRGGTFLEHLDAYNLILKLGRMGAYDNARRIRGPDVSFVANTDIAHLIEEAMRPSRIVNGADIFVDLLAASKIDPDSIVNDTLRAKLVKRLEQQHDASDNNTNSGDSDGPSGPPEHDHTYPRGRRSRRGGSSAQDSSPPSPGPPSASEQPLPNEVIFNNRRPVVRLERIVPEDYL